jgi:hypothetical protein
MKRAKKPTWEMRRAHFRTTAMRRGGMPLPGSFVFFLEGADGETPPPAPLLACEEGTGEESFVDAASSVSTGPAFPVIQGIGLAWSGGCAATG